MQGAPPRKVALVTGAVRRLGAAIARSLAVAGWGVVLHARTRGVEAEEFRATLAQTSGAEVWLVAGDLEPDGGPENVFAAALAAAGQIDALVNNASIFTRQALSAATASDFSTNWRVNTLAPILLTQCLARHLTMRGTCGAVVNLLDQRIVRHDTACVPYWLSKKMLAEYTKTAALGYAPSLRVNAVAPGAILTPTNFQGAEPAGDFPLGSRPGGADVAHAVRCLLEHDGLTGQTLFVDGGQHLL